jgi:hypothetical protein
MRRIFGPRRDEVTGGWRKTHNEELHDLCSLPSVIRIIKWKRNMYRLLVGKPEGKRPLGTLRYKWVDNIKLDLVEIAWGGVDWIGLVQDRYKWRALVNVVLNLCFPQNAVKVSSSS